ncbi:hypothetical protein SCLCIDRAFT_404479 [Scleroderma citrinum Foug A]|uniref:Uncharacterized protein n=1 Tax=Scleroderma citrinum Foug A TaxID=1036808 RepID=A0A0C3CZJ3_9AGAM|nr:hypothetical protein SCLCIDRAFT_404479 [Scleroderma citrinum Foug A]
MIYLCPWSSKFMVKHRSIVAPKSVQGRESHRRYLNLRWARKSPCTGQFTPTHGDSQIQSGEGGGSTVLSASLNHQGKLAEANHRSRCQNRAHSPRKYYDNLNCQVPERVTD